MKTHEFSVILDREPDEAEADAIAGIVDDASIVTIAGVPQMWFHRESEHLDTAIQSAAAEIQKAGFKVERIVIEGDLLKSA